MFLRKKQNCSIIRNKIKKKKKNQQGANAPSLFSLSLGCFVCLVFFKGFIGHLIHKQEVGDCWFAPCVWQSERMVRANGFQFLSLLLLRSLDYCKHGYCQKNSCGKTASFESESWNSETIYFLKIRIWIWIACVWLQAGMS